MLGDKKFYVKFDEKVIRPDVLNNGKFSSDKRYLVLAVQNVEHTWHILFVDDENKISAMNIEKFTFAGFEGDPEPVAVHSEPVIIDTLALPVINTVISDQIEGVIEVEKKTYFGKPRGRQKASA